VLAEELQRQEDEVIEVDRALRPQGSLVEGENFRNQPVVVVALPFRARHRGDAGILRPRDGAHHPPRVKHAFVDAYRAHQSPDEGQLVTGVGHCKTLRPAEPVEVLACHLGAEGMEG